MDKFLKNFLHWAGVVLRFLFYVFLSLGAACGIYSALVLVGIIKIMYDFSTEETEYQKPAQVFFQYFIERAHLMAAGKAYSKDADIANYHNIMQRARALAKESEPQKC